MIGSFLAVFYAIISLSVGVFVVVVGGLVLILAAIGTAPGEVKAFGGIAHFFLLRQLELTIALDTIKIDRRHFPTPY